MMSEGAPSTPSVEPTRPTSKLPPITKGTSELYATKLNELKSRSSLLDPLSIFFAMERLPAGQSLTCEWLLWNNEKRIKSKLAVGSVIVEAGDWAAAAVWDPPGSKTEEGGKPRLPEEWKTERPSFWEFEKAVERAKLEVLGEDITTKGLYWNLSLMGRDPERKEKGAVRAVIESLMAQAKLDGLPVWLETGNPRARDVYGWLGFETRKEFYIGKGKLDMDGKPDVGGVGKSIWCMVYRPPSS